MITTLVDTGPIVALLNPKDAHHEWARSCFDSFSSPLPTCESVISEALHLLGRLPVSRTILASMIAEGVFDISFQFISSQREILALLEKYHDSPMDFADACLVRLSEIHSNCKVWTLDKDFKFYRRNNRRIVPVLAPWS